MVSPTHNTSRFKIFIEDNLIRIIETVENEENDGFQLKEKIVFETTKSSGDEVSLFTTRISKLRLHTNPFRILGAKEFWKQQALGKEVTKVFTDSD